MVDFSLSTHVLREDILFTLWLFHIASTSLASALSTLFHLRLAIKKSQHIMFWACVHILHLEMHCLQLIRENSNKRQVNFVSPLPIPTYLWDLWGDVNCKMNHFCLSGACGEGYNPWCHLGSGGEQDEGSTRLQDSTESRGRPLHEVCGCISHYTQHLWCKWPAKTVILNFLLYIFALYL